LSDIPHQEFAQFLVTWLAGNPVAVAISSAKPQGPGQPYQTFKKNLDG